MLKVGYKFAEIVGEILVAFDRNRLELPSCGYYIFKKVPDLIMYRTRMHIHHGTVGPFPTCEVYLHDPLQRNRIKELYGIEAVICCVEQYVSDVEQETALTLLHYLRKKFGL